MTEAIVPVRVENSPKVEANRYRPGIKGLFERVKNFVGITEKVETATSEVPKEKVEQVSGMGFFERVGAAIDRGINKVKETSKKAWNFVKEKWNQAGEYFKEESAEVQERRQKLGIVDTVKSYVQDGVDAVRSKVDLVEAKWKDAEVSQLVGERVKLRDSYEKAKEMKAKGEEVLRGYIVSRNQLREALRPIRVAELAARKERRELRAESKQLRRKIETKENSKALLAKAKEKNKMGLSNQSAAAAI